MRLNTSELVGFKRFDLNGINVFRITPTERMQMILGSNGSGKSSLLEEISPMPGIATNYKKGGRKVVSYTHHGNDYVMTSDFTSGQTHSMLKNGEELNKGGTVTVQKELVRQEFGITSDIHELLIGRVRFTDMQPVKRREWFTQLCDNNYDYALDVFSKARDKAREANIGLKLARKRLVTEAAKVGTQADVDRIKQQIAEISREVHVLYNARSDVSDDSYVLQQEQNKMLAELQAFSYKLLSLKAGVATFLTPGELREGLEAQRLELAEVNTRISVLMEERGTLEQAQKAHEASGAQGVQELKDRLEKLRSDKSEVLSNRRLNLEGLDPVVAATAFESVHETLIELLTVLPENKERQYGQAKLQEAQARLQDLDAKIKQANDKLEQLRHQKHHLDEIVKGGDQECPQCKFKWIPGFEQGVYEKVVKSIDDGGTYLATAREKRVAVFDEVDKNVSYGNLFREFSRCVRNVTTLKPFWDYLLDNEYVQNSPRFAMAQLGVLKHDLDLEVRAASIESEITRIKDMIQIAMKASDSDMSKVVTRMDKIDEELGMYTKRQVYISRSMQDSQVVLNKVNEFFVLDDKIRSLLNRIQFGYETLTKAVRNEIIDECLAQHQAELGQKQNLLNELLLQKSRVEDLELQVMQLAREDEVMKVVVDALSPTDGLIAEGLLGFVKNFVRQMNAIINKIWTYKLEVKDCSVDSESGAGLDFKFPMVVKQSKNDPVPDVSKGSRGQQEVIDLAFKIVAMRHLGLSEAPLVLDEFASSFDDAHKVNAMQAVKTLMEQFPFSQLYMVSHFQNHYGVFANAQICVLDKENIILPSSENYNQHVFIG